MDKDWKVQSWFMGHHDQPVDRWSDAQTGTMKHKAASPAGDRLAVTVQRAGNVKPILVSLLRIKYMQNTLYTVYMR